MSDGATASDHQLGDDDDDGTVISCTTIGDFLPRECKYGLDTSDPQTVFQNKHFYFVFHRGGPPKIPGLHGRGTETIRIGRTDRQADDGSTLHILSPK